MNYLLKLLLSLILPFYIVEDEAGGKDTTETDDAGAETTDDAGTETTEEEGAPETMLDAVEKELNLEEGEEDAGPDVEGKGKEVKDTKDAAADKPDGEDKTPLPAETKDTGEEEEQDALGDLINIPKGMKKEHRAAYKALADKAVELNNQNKEFAQLAGQARENAETLQGFQEVINNSGATPEQMADAFDYLYFVNTGNLPAAKEILQKEMNVIYQLSGETPPGVDVLADYPDLKEQVESLTITQEVAEELARMRNKDKLLQQGQQQQDQQRQQQTQTQQQFQAKKAQAMKDVEVFLRAKAQSDKENYAYRNQELTRRMTDRESTLHQNLRKLDPTLWQRAIELEYDAIQPAAPGAEQPGGSSKDKQPLRPRSGGGGNKEPKDMTEAISQSLGYS